MTLHLEYTCPHCDGSGNDCARCARCEGTGNLLAPDGAVLLDFLRRRLFAGQPTIRDAARGGLAARLVNARDADDARRILGLPWQGRQDGATP